MAFIYQDKLNQRRYITSKTLKNKLITLQGNEYDEEKTSAYNTETEELFGFFGKIGVATPKVLDYDNIMLLLQSKLTDDDLDDFLPIFAMERVHFLSIVYLLNENLATVLELKKIIKMPFYSRSEYLIKYLSRETVESNRSDIFLTKFYDIISTLNSDKYTKIEKTMDRDISFTNIQRVMTGWSFNTFLSTNILDNYIASTKGQLYTQGETYMYFTLYRFLQPFLETELPKYVGGVFRNRLNVSDRMSYGLYQSNYAPDFSSSNNLLSWSVGLATNKIFKAIANPSEYGTYFVDTGKYLDFVKIAYTTDMETSDFLAPDGSSTDFAFILNSKLKELLEKIFPSFALNGTTRIMNVGDSDYFVEYMNHRNSKGNFYWFRDESISADAKSLGDQLSEFNMKIDKSDSISINGVDNYRLRSLDETHLPRFKEILRNVMNDLSIQPLDLEAPNLDWAIIEAYIDELVAALDETEDNRFAFHINDVEDYNESLTLMYYIDIFRKYLLYLKGTLNENQIPYVKEALYNDYKVIVFIQQTFAIFSDIYNKLENDNHFNAYKKVLIYEWAATTPSTTSGTTYTSKSVSTSGGGGGGGGAPRMIAYIDQEER